MLTAHPVAGKQKAVDICNAFTAGAPHDAEGHVFYGVNDTNLGAWRRVLGSGKDFWWIDGSYFDKARGLFFRVTKNRLQHTGLGETDGARFTRLGIDVKPMVHFSSGPVIAVEQSESFMRIHAGEKRPGAGRPPASGRTWLERRVAQNALGRKVKWRTWSGDKIKQGLSLAVDLQGAGMLITHSSAAAVEALVAGVPAIVSQMSCCALTAPADRMRLFGVLADNVFTLTEMRSGAAWAALNK